MFFKSRPNLSPNEKAQVEFYFQWIADCVGYERMQLPVLRSEQLLTGQTTAEVVNTVGKHLSHNIDQLKIVVQPEVLEKCGGGG